MSDPEINNFDAAQFIYLFQLILTAGGDVRLWLTLA